MYKYGNYNIPRIAKTFHIYDYVVVPRIGQTSGAGNFSKWVSTSLCNSIEDMITGAGNNAMSGIPTLQGYYDNALPLQFRVSHTYIPNYTPTVTNSTQLGKYILIGGFSASATNPFEAAVASEVTNATLAQHLEQILRARLVPYWAKIRVFDLRHSNITPKFHINGSLHLQKFTERSLPDLWSSAFGYVAAAGGNPTSLIYYHSLLLYVRPFTEPALINMSTNIRTGVKVHWNRMYENLVAQG